MATSKKGASEKRDEQHDGTDSPHPLSKQQQHAPVSPEGGPLRSAEGELLMPYHAGHPDVEKERAKALATWRQGLRETEAKLGSSAPEPKPENPAHATASGVSIDGVQQPRQRVETIVRKPKPTSQES